MRRTLCKMQGAADTGEDTGCRETCKTLNTAENAAQDAGQAVRHYTEPRMLAKIRDVQQNV